MDIHFWIVVPVYLEMYFIVKERPVLQGYLCDNQESCSIMFLYSN